MLVPAPDAVWGLDFARDDGTAGFLRLMQFGDRCWCWAYLVGPAIGLVVMRDHDVAPPRRTTITSKGRLAAAAGTAAADARLLDVRADGLWMELVCETPGEHWTYGLEAFAVRLDEPGDALRGEIGERLPMGVDLEWETDGSGVTGSVHGALLVGPERVELEAAGVLRNAMAPDTAWPTEWTGRCRLDDDSWVGPPARFESVVEVPVPLGAEASGHGPVLVRVLARMHGEAEATGVGWLEVLQSRDTDEGSPRHE